MGAGRPEVREAPAGLEGGGRPRLDELREILSAFHEVTGFPFRVVLRRIDGEVELHDSLSSRKEGGETERRELRASSAVSATLELPVGEEGSRGDPDDPADAGEVELLEALVRRVVAEDARRGGLLDELRERGEEIALLTSISETLGSVIDLELAARRILLGVVDVLDASRATLWRVEGSTGELVLIASQGITDPAVRRVSPADRGSLIARAFSDQRSYLVGPVDSERREISEELREAVVGYEGSAVVAVPVTYSPPEGPVREVGVLGLVGRELGDPFTESDLRMVEAIASQIGAAIENGRLVREEVRRERLTAELELAHELQLKLLPDPERFSDLAEVSARCEPAESVGGDFYQLIRLPEGKLGVMLGDVSSHGISAALVMAQAMSAAAIYAREVSGPGEVLQRLDRALERELRSADMIITVFYGILDPATATLRYASAGHPYAYWLGQREVVRLETGNVPLGAGAASSLVEFTHDPGEEGGGLFAFTDGLFEASPGSRQEAERAVVEAARSALGRGSESALSAAFALSDEPRPADDRTAVLIRL